MHCVTRASCCRGQVGWFLREAADTLDRRDKQSATDIWLSSNLGYPDYSLKTFHFQVCVRLAYNTLPYMDMI